MDAADPGDTIIVRDGIYTENVDMNKRLTIRSENGSENCIVQAASSYDHVFEVMAGYVNINGFTVIGAMGMWNAGIYLTSGADYCAISNNNASNNDCGIYFDYSNNNTLNNNIASNNDWGIHLGQSSNNTIISNTVNSNDYGILLGSSPKNKLSDNVISNNKIINLLVDGVDIDDYKNDIDTSNKVNGKSVYYYFGENHLVLNHLDTNHITAANCSNITIKNNNITDGDPITLVFTTESIVKNNTINHSESNFAKLANDIFDGVSLQTHTSTPTPVIALTPTPTPTPPPPRPGRRGAPPLRSGILLRECNNSIARDNSISGSAIGVHVSSSDSNILINNNASKNNYYGIRLHSSSNNTLISNALSNNTYNFGVDGWSLSDFIQNIDTSNKVNGKPVYYCVNQQNQQIPNDAGFVGIVNSTNMTVRDLTLTNNSEGVLLVNSNNSMVENVSTSNNGIGIRLYSSSNNTLTDNNASNNGDGMSLYSSSGNTITNSNASNNRGCGILLRESSSNNIENSTANSNDWCGIYLTHSSNSNTIASSIITNNEVGVRFFDASNNNTIASNNINSNNWEGIDLSYSSNNNIYLNNFINNSYNVYSGDSTNIWNSTEKITYTYNGSQYTNYLGNYWDDYTDIDADNDGIWDNPRSIDSDKDYHPLVEPFENYFAENIFDTGSPANPYPSIFGAHKGTIKPYHYVNVSRMYTYPCAGTGGHTEFIEIYENGTLIANGSWKGYVGDWHNITFDVPFTLEKGKIYNYTIRTGSYPQIHHTDRQEIDDGVITCDNFVDANGKVYTDWIPAIRLE